MDNLNAIAPLQLSPTCYERIMAAYSHPPRAYHSWDHVLEVTQHWHDVAQRMQWERPKETFLAVLFHDAIYVAGKSDNEARSAQLARTELATLASIDIGEIERLIKLTSSHGKLQPADVDRDTSLFLDCDMAILGAPPDRFIRYEQDIRTEYAGISNLMFNSGRQRFLEKLLCAPRIFLSEDFHRRLDRQAREIFIIPSPH